MSAALGDNVHYYQSVCITTLGERIESIVLSLLQVDSAASSPAGGFAGTTSQSVPTGVLHHRRGRLLDGFPPQGAFATMSAQKPPPPNGAPAHADGPESPHGLYKWRTRLADATCSAHSPASLFPISAAGAPLDAPLPPHRPMIDSHRGGGGALALLGSMPQPFKRAPTAVARLCHHRACTGHRRA